MDWSHWRGQPQSQAQDCSGTWVRQCLTAVPAQSGQRLLRAPAESPEGLLSCPCSSLLSSRGLSLDHPVDGSKNGLHSICCLVADNTRMEMTSLISTSNRMIADQLKVETDADILWVTEVKD